MKRIPMLLLAIGLGTMTPKMTTSQQADRREMAADIPAWFLAYMKSQVGVWEADNTAYKSAEEPYDAYRIEWAWGIGKTSIVGRLYGVANGNDIGSFWEMRSYWDPDKRQVIAFQIGADGTVGIGTEQVVAQDQTRIEQRFHNPDGSSYDVGHKTMRDGDVQTTESFDIDGEGNWTKRRTYDWRRTLSE